MKEIELLEDIKKKEEHADRKIRDAQDKAEKLIASAREAAQEALEKARADSAEDYEKLMQKTTEQVGEQHDEIIDLANKKVQKIKKVEGAAVLALFKKALKERFGV